MSAGAIFAASVSEIEMSDDMDIVRGSGNVFRDLGRPDADREQLRALLAAQIIGVLDDRKLTVRAAYEMTGIARPTSPASATPISAAARSTG
jgi:hypothetical protein